MFKCNYVVRKIVSKEYGSASVLAILLVLVFVTIGKVLYSVAASEYKIGLNLKNGIIAECLAQDGARKAIYELNKNALWEGVAPPGQSLSRKMGGVYTVEILRPKVDGHKLKGDVLWVKSIGRCADAERVMCFAYVWPPEYQNPVYEYTLFAGNNMIVHEAKSIKGLKIGSRTNVVVEGSIYKDDSRKLNICVPKICLDSYRHSIDHPPTDKELNDGVGLSGKVYYYNAAPHTSYVIKDYRTLSGNGIMCTNYHMNIKEGVSIPDRVTIIAHDNIYIGNKCKIRKALLIAGNNITFGDNVNFCGVAIAGGEIIVGRGTAIKRDETVLKKIKTNYISY